VSTSAPVAAALPTTTSRRGARSRAASPPAPGAARLARVILRDGEELQLERGGDLGEGNAGMLIFVEGRPRPEYVPWTDVEQVDFDPSGLFAE